MKVRIVVFAMLIIIFGLAGYNKISEEKKLAISTWGKVANEQFSNWDFGAGTGLYFYEEDIGNKKVSEIELIIEDDGRYKVYSI